MPKKKILFLQPLFYNPTAPNFKDRFEFLSETYCGDVLSFNTTQEYNGMRFGDFTYHSITLAANKRIFKHFFYTFHILKKALKIHKSKKIEFVHTYDPLFFGMMGVIIKFITGAKLIVEVNGEYKVAAFLQKKHTFQSKVKKSLFLTVISVVLKLSDIHKFLNDNQKNQWSKCSINKKAVIFHEFVPTYIFSEKVSEEGNYIFFIGHPFHLKGVDILIKAFLKISDKFPQYKLKIVGHCHGRDKERNMYIDMCQGNANIEILKPVYYDEAIKLFKQCIFFVLPSRTEAMGRVLIEAMASGKPVIGSRVGGIPQVIEDEGNGFLFTSEDADELAEKMERLLSNKELRKRMGQRSLELIETRFSAQKYVEYFTEMLRSEH